MDSMSFNADKLSVAFFPGSGLDFIPAPRGPE